jgi:hypothetical protein
MRDTNFDSWVARARATPIEAEINRRGLKLKREGLEQTGACPKCGGEDRFAINLRKKVFHCRGCSTGGDVIALVSFLDGSDFIGACTALVGEPPPANGKDRDASAKAITATYPYVDEQRRLLFEVVRFEPKSFRQRKPDGNGGWTWKLDGVRRVLFQLPEVIKAVTNDHPVFIVEGEKDVLSLNKANVVATTNPGGAGKWRPEYSEHLRDADVILVPDADNKGHEHVQAVGLALQGVARRVRVLVLPAKDASEWLAAGHTREELDALAEAAPAWAPVTTTPDVTDDEKAKAQAREDELLDALAKTKGLDYARQRKAAAEELGVPPSAIDNEVKARREDAQVGPLDGHWVVLPAEEPADGDSLLRDIIRRIKRHVVISDDGALTIALWVVASWVHDEVATHSPILNINSTEPESGKSTTMALVAFLMPKCIASVEASEAAIYRAIKRWQPSFCFDEFDSILADDDKAALRSVINSGHTRGQGVLRCIGDDKTPELFPTFAPKAIGKVGRKLPPATLSRCIFVELRRRKKDEHVERFAHQDDAELADLRGRLRRWALDNQDALRDAEPSMPDELQNRRHDNWRLMIRISDLCSGVEDFGDKARAAAIKIEGKADSRTASARALAACKTVFESVKDDAIGSEELIEKITADPNSEWAEWKAGKPITQMQLARLLKPYGISPEPVRIGTRQVRGYLRAHFIEAWERYL